MGIFENATRKKLRFNTNKGDISVEDLWDVPLLSSTNTSLDDLAQELNRVIKAGTEESFVKKPTPDPVMADNKLKFDIVKRVIEVKVEEQERKEKAAERKAKKEKLLAALADKQDESIKSASVEDIQKMLAELDD